MAVTMVRPLAWPQDFREFASGTELLQNVNVWTDAAVLRDAAGANTLSVSPGGAWTIRAIASHRSRIVIQMSVST